MSTLLINQTTKSPTAGYMFVLKVSAFKSDLTYKWRIKDVFVFQGAMMSIAFKEGLKIPPQAMEQIIVGANQDVRQVN